MAEAESGFWSRRGIKPWLFESLAENAARVCGDSDAIIFLKRNGALRHIAHYGSILTATKKGESGPPIDDRRSVPGRAFVDGETVHVHDVQATVLHLLGLDHERLIYRHAGRDFRLTDVYGEVVKELIA